MRSSGIIWIGQILAKYCLLIDHDSSFQTPPVPTSGVDTVVTLSVAAIVAIYIAFSGSILILLVAVVVIPVGCCYYHRKTKKSVHKVVAPFQRLECMLTMSLITRCGQSKSHATYRVHYIQKGNISPTQSICCQVA